MTDGHRKELIRYCIGAVLSSALTAVAFWVVMGARIPSGAAYWVIGTAAVGQVGVQLRCFLHIGWHQKREDLHLILFSLLLLGLMLGGTIWIAASLASRMQ